MMQRSKLFAIALAALVATAGSVILLSGGAAASQWHAYQGDVHPGQAYTFAIPSGADAIEFAFADAGAGRARFAVFDPAGAAVGYYELSSSPTAASLAAPLEGRYAVYVYEVTSGALTLRVSAEQAPDLQLQKATLAREDIVLTRVDAPQRLDQVMTAQLQQPPVFVTLLYQGSAENLDATVSSPRGVIATVLDETATAFSPGVWSSQTGVRASDPSNLAAGAQTVTATADQFQGTLVLTALSLAAPVAVPIEHPEVAPAPILPDEGGVFAVGAQQPLAVTLPVGAVTIADARWVAEQAAPAEDEDDAHGHHHKGGRHYSRHVESVLLVYTPSDELLTVLRLDEDMPVATLDIPEAGEYVLYASQTSEDGLLAKLENVAGLPEIRTLEVEMTSFEFETSSFLIGGGDSIAFTLDRVPLQMTLYSEDGIGAFDSAYVTNEMGTVVEMHRVLSLGPGGIWSHSAETPENFLAGDHVLSVGGLVASSTFRLESLHFVREAVAQAAPQPASPVEEGEPGEEPASGEEEEGRGEDEGWLPPLHDVPLPPL